ncbi:MAG: hypothetical protein WCP85_29890 [Mariniphaga sp.]
MKTLFIAAGIPGGIFIVGYVLRFLIRLKRKRMPNERKKKKIYRQINHWKDLGYNYNKRLELLIAKGYPKNVANIILGEAEYMTVRDPNRNSYLSSKQSVE